ncbi:polysaccharide lyase family 7 protein [Pseudomonas sp.]|uniref:polysaccharide lyase family 7 protein n=1 Tax=Pseudomonas sp. TaxID=306 RepID=UPI003263A85C
MGSSRIAAKDALDLHEKEFATPLPISDTNPIALELIGWHALLECPDVISKLEDGSLQMTAPTLGASSKSTLRTRCEWKEPGYWLFSSATDHWSRQKMRLMKVNSLQKVVIGQIHVKDSERPPVKVFWNKGKITMGFRSSYLQDDPVNSTILENVPLGALVKINIHANSNGAVSVSASCNGVKSTSAIMRLDNTWDTKTLAVHGGVYNQIDYSDTTDPLDGSVCVISDLSITHA